MGVKKADLPDLTVKQVKVYVTSTANLHWLNGSETGEIVAVVTNSGIEGNYSLGNRERTTGWLEWAKATIPGKSVLDLLPTLNATSGMKGRGGFDTHLRPGGGAVRPVRRVEDTVQRHTVGGFVAVPDRSGGAWPDYRAAAADLCLWDILGKAVGQPIYKLLGGSKDRMMAHASSPHLPAIEDYVPDVLKAKEQGYKGYKIHPGAGQHRNGKPIPSYVGHMEEIREVRKAVGDEYVLAHDPVQAYNRYEAMAVGRLLDELDYLWFEDPILTTDVDGLVQLASALDVPLPVGEFLASISDFAEYIRRGAVDVVRLIADNVDGISGSMRWAFWPMPSAWSARPTTGGMYSTWRSTFIWNSHCPTRTGSRCRSRRSTRTGLTTETNSASTRTGTYTRPRLQGRPILSIGMCLTE